MSYQIQVLKWKIDKIKFIDLNASKEIHERWTRFDDKKSVILFVDIAPSPHVYEKLKTNNKRIIVIDHHHLP
jgi:nanoRNase/pAp phosphatase (c-di-AMP/oligoRNAs hydrolase)